jgi:hypothetical protein
LGNNLFQYWVAQYIADQLEWPIKLQCDCPENDYLSTDVFPNIRATREPVDNNRCKFDQEHHGEYFIDIDALIAEHRRTQEPVHISKYLECFDIFENREDYIKQLYARRVALPKHDRVAIHLRLGDLSSYYVPLMNEYIDYVVGVVNRHKKDVLIVSEDPGHPCTQNLYRAIHSRCPSALSVTCKPSSPPMSDFDDLASSTVLVMGNSTFSWWAAYLNEHVEEVNVFLHPDQPFFNIRRSLFTPKLPKWKFNI